MPEWGGVTGLNRTLTEKQYLSKDLKDMKQVTMRGYIPRKRGHVGLALWKEIVRVFRGSSEASVAGGE